MRPSRDRPARSDKGVPPQTDAGGSCIRSGLPPLLCHSYRDKFVSWHEPPHLNDRRIIFLPITPLDLSLASRFTVFFKEYEITITLREIKVLFCCSPLGSIVRYCFGNRPNWYVWAKHTPPPETSWLHVHNNWIWNRCPRLFVFCCECMRACVWSQYPY